MQGLVSRVFFSTRKPLKRIIVFGVLIPDGWKRDRCNQNVSLELNFSVISTNSWLEQVKGSNIILKLDLKRYYIFGQR